MNLYEILVPCQRNDGRPIRLRFHRVWDEKVIQITNGLTIMKPINDKWVGFNGTRYTERMIPVRIRCTDEQMKEIAKFTKKYYEQFAVFYYKISSEAYIV